LAFEGVQVLVAMLSVTGTEPLFFRYTVLVAEVLGESAPQSMLVQLTVQALSE
jgi:hypothetical protein